MEIINKVIELLENNGLEQKDLYSYLGVKAQTFSDWKAGRNKSYMKYITQIANFFNVSVAYLTGETDTKEKKPSLFESFSAEEIELIKAYRKHPEARVYARRILGLEAPPETARIAAKGNGEIQAGKKKPKITD